MTVFDNFDEIYSAMVAGSVPSAEGSPDSLLMVVQDILGTDNLHLFFSFDAVAHRIFYFAAPSAVFHSVGEIHLPLVAAIPGQPGHRGRGAYCVTTAGLTVAAVYDDGNLRLLVNSADAVQESLAESLLPVYDVSTTDGVLFESMRGKLRRERNQLSRKLASTYGLLAAVMGAAYVALSLATGYFQKTFNDESTERQQALEKLAANINFASPLHERLARLQKVSTVVVRSGGWIEEYELDRGRETFRLLLPEWVTADHYRDLDAEVSADSQGDGMVAVVSVNKPVAADARRASAQQGAGAGASETKGVPGGAPGQGAGLVPNQALNHAAAKPPSQAPAQAPFGSPASRPPSSGLPPS